MKRQNSHAPLIDESSLNSGHPKIQILTCDPFALYITKVTTRSLGDGLLTVPANLTEGLTVYTNMETKQLSLNHLVKLPPSSQSQEPGAGYPTILTLHGLGSNEHDLIGLAPHLPDGLLWISPRAPLTLGQNSFEWYRVKVIGRPDPEQVDSALETIDHFVEEILSAYPIDPEKLFLLGFSQGSLLSMCYGLTHPARVAGVIAQSGYIPLHLKLEINEREVKNKPFILTHGEQDTMLPIEWARASRDRLEQLGVDLAYHEFQMGHTVSLDSLKFVCEWLKKQLAR